jgi:hypothetical protein
MRHYTYHITSFALARAVSDERGCSSALAVLVELSKHRVSAKRVAGTILAGVNLLGFPVPLWGVFPGWPP